MAALRVEDPETQKQGETLVTQQNGGTETLFNQNTVAAFSASLWGLQAEELPQLCAPVQVGTLCGENQRAPGKWACEGGASSQARRLRADGSTRFSPNMILALLKNAL